MNFCRWALAVALVAGCAEVAGAAVGAQVLLHATRLATSDLEITGRVRGLPPGGHGYVRYEELARLPQVETEIRDADLGGGEVRVAGVYVDVLEKAVGARPDADLIDAVCGDGYRSPLPAEYVAAHRPILVLRIDGMRPGEWARRGRKDDPGPYLIEYENFVPGFRVLAHVDRPQVPWDVVRLDFASQAETFGAIGPRGSFAEGSAEMEGFAIAKQNCLRCHSMGRVGGTKSGKSWTALGRIAERRPEWFAEYVRDPKAAEADAKMPGNPEYNAATTAALTAYFRTFAAAAEQGRMAGGDGARGRRP
jgi:hypothetical protein